MSQNTDEKLTRTEQLTAYEVGAKVYDHIIVLTCTRKITPSEWRESTKVKIGDSSNEKDF